MRNTIIYVLFHSCLLLACSKSEVEKIKNSLTIVPSNLTLNFDAEASSQFYTLKSDNPVQVSSDNPDWCNAIFSNVTIDNLKISVSDNENLQSRKAIVTVKSGDEIVQILVNQNGIKPVIEVDRNSVLIQFGKPEFTLEITSNIPIAFLIPDWIEIQTINDWRKGKNLYTFALADLPDELSIREGVITIQPEDGSIDIQPVSIYVTQKTTPQIIAHRGYWSTPDYPQNSLASLQRAIGLGIYGSELDVWITKDGEIVLNHDATIDGINIENSTFSELQHVRLSNGESIPTLEACLKILQKQTKTKLIIELKSHTTTENENRAVAAVLELIDAYGVTDQVDYISFSQNICKSIIAANPKNRVAYLNGNIAPNVLKADGYWGFDYAISVLKNNSGWIQSARDLGLKTNVWTVNSSTDFDYFISLGIDYVTTDYPRDFQQILNSYGN